MGGSFVGRHHLHRVKRVVFGKLLARSDQLLELGGELVGVEGRSAGTWQDRCPARSTGQSGRVEPPGVEHFGDPERHVVGQHHAAGAHPMEFVAAATWAMSTSATNRYPGHAVVLGRQKRVYQGFGELRQLTVFSACRRIRCPPGARSRTEQGSSSACSSGLRRIPIGVPAWFHDHCTTGKRFALERVLLNSHRSPGRKIKRHRKPGHDSPHCCSSLATRDQGPRGARRARRPRAPFQIRSPGV